MNYMFLSLAGVQPLGGPRGPCPSQLKFDSQTKQSPTISVSTSGILAFMGVEKLNGPEILRFLARMLQFLDYLWQLFFFPNYISEIDHFM